MARTVTTSRRDEQARRPGWWRPPQRRSVGRPISRARRRCRWPLSRPLLALRPANGPVRPAGRRSRRAACRHANGGEAAPSAAGVLRRVLGQWTAALVVGDHQVDSELVGCRPWRRHELRESRPQWPSPASDRGHGLVHPRHRPAISLAGGWLISDEQRGHAARCACWSEMIVLAIERRTASCSAAGFSEAVL